VLHELPVTRGGDRFLSQQYPDYLGGGNFAVRVFCEDILDRTTSGFKMIAEINLSMWAPFKNVRQVARIYQRIDQRLALRNAAWSLSCTQITGLRRSLIFDGVSESPMGTAAGSRAPILQPYLGIRQYLSDFGVKAVFLLKKLTFPVSTLTYLSGDPNSAPECAPFKIRSFPSGKELPSRCPLSRLPHSVK
jgi:hypothetical protein